MNLTAGEVRALPIGTRLIVAYDNDGTNSWDQEITMPAGSVAEIMGRNQAGQMELVYQTGVYGFWDDDELEDTFALAPPGPNPFIGELDWDDVLVEPHMHACLAVQGEDRWIMDVRFAPGVDRIVAKAALIEALQQPAGYAVKVVTQIKSQDIADLMVTAIEGGINDWCNGAHIPGTGHEKYSEGSVYEQDFVWQFEDDEGSQHRLDPEQIRKGFQIMATQYKRHFDDFISENYDATTADVWLQCCLFGEVIYG